MRIPTALVKTPDRSSKNADLTTSLMNGKALWLSFAPSQSPLQPGSHPPQLHQSPSPSPVTCFTHSATLPGPSVCLASSCLHTCCSLGLGNTPFSSTSWCLSFLSPHFKNPLPDLPAHVPTLDCTLWQHQVHSLPITHSDSYAFIRVLNGCRCPRQESLMWN